MINSHGDAGGAAENGAMLAFLSVDKNLELAAREAVEGNCVEDAGNAVFNVQGKECAASINQTVMINTEIRTGRNLLSYKKVVNTMAGHGELLPLMLILATEGLVKHPTGAAPSYSMFRMLVVVVAAIQMALKRGPEGALEKEMEEVLSKAEKENLGGGCAFLVLAEGICAYSHDQKFRYLASASYNDGEARVQRLKDADSLVAKFASDHVSAEHKVLLERWSGAAEEPKRSLPYESPGPLKKPFVHKEKETAKSKGFKHCVKFQHGLCTGTSKADCPDGGEHVIKKCWRKYPAGGKCAEHGDDCWFGHP